MTAPLDLVGRTFGRLVVIRRTENNRHGKAMFLVHCRCGSDKTVLGAKLMCGETTSCGCLRIEQLRTRSVTHAESHKAPEYRSWQSMLRRCETPSIPSYAKYGGRGITVCLRWHDYENFLTDMGRRPSIDYSIDRIDNDGGYWCGKCEECRRLKRPANCRWATDAQQSRNTRRNRLLTFQGETLCIADWEIRLGISRGTITDRIRRGYPIERILSTTDYRFTKEAR